MFSFYGYLCRNQRKIESITMESITMESITMESITMESSTMESSTMESSTMEQLTMELSNIELTISEPSEINAENLHNALLIMPYFRNHAAASGAVHNVSNHETAVEHVFRQHGFAEDKTKLTKNKVNQALAHNIEVISRNTFKSQPCGSHESPDFLVNMNGRMFGFECKSTTKKVSKPLYNSGSVKRNLIYIFTNEIENATTLYLGCDIITHEQEKIIAELIQKQRELQSEYNKKLLDLDTNNRGISYYTRPMIGQSGKSEKTNYFTHGDRKKCEDNVLKFLMTYE